MSFEDFRTGLAASAEVAEYYEEWHSRLEKKVAEKEAKKTQHQEDEKVYATKHPILYRIFGYSADWDFTDDYALCCQKSNLRAVKRAVDEARYNERNKVIFTRVHMDFFEIDE